MGVGLLVVNADSHVGVSVIAQGEVAVPRVVSTNCDRGAMSSPMSAGAPLVLGPVITSLADQAGGEECRKGVTQAPSPNNMALLIVRVFVENDSDLAIAAAPRAPLTLPEQ